MKPTTDKEVNGLTAFVVENTWLTGRNKGWGNGYVAIPKNHPCYGLGYYEIQAKYNIRVNGGLTYADNKMFGQPKETKGMWIVGFDTCHCFDTMEIWPDADAVMKEAELLKQQLTDLTFTEKWLSVAQKYTNLSKYDTLKAENEKLLSDVKILREALNEICITADSDEDNNIKLLAIILNKSRKALNQTK